MKINIRSASEKDIKEILPLWSELSMFHTSFNDFFKITDGAENEWETFLKSIFSVQNENKACIFVAETNSPNQIVGYIMGMIRMNPPIFVIQEYVYTFDSRLFLRLPPHTYRGGHLHLRKGGSHGPTLYASYSHLLYQIRKNE